MSRSMFANCSKERQGRIQRKAHYDLPAKYFSAAHVHGILGALRCLEADRGVVHALERCPHPPVRRREFGGGDADAAAGSDLDIDDLATMGEVPPEVLILGR